MAKAFFRCAECGQDVTVFGTNRRDAERLARWHESRGSLCQNCEAEKRRAESAAAAEANRAAGLPALTGSEKQVAWAETLRTQALAQLAALAPYAATSDPLPQDSPDRLYMADQLRALRALVAEGGEAAIQALTSLMRAKAEARWWIDTRELTMAQLIQSLRDDLVVALRPTPPLTPEEAAAQEEALLRPPGEPVCGHVAEIAFVPPSLRVRMPVKHEEFRQAMRDAGFSWRDGFWARDLGPRNGDPADRMAETAHRILALGFLARLHDTRARAMALDGSFQPEQKRWVVKATTGPYAGWFRLDWPRDDDFYEAAKRLLGARYHRGHVHVPPGSADEVEDFAERHGFVFSDGARELIDRHRAEIAAGITVAEIKAKPAPVKVPAPRVPAQLAPPDTDEPDDALRDED